jgi:hypothetical protein
MNRQEERGPDLRIDGQGEIVPLGEKARAAIQAWRGLWRIAPSHGDVLLLERHNPTAREDRVVLVGTLQGMEILDIINHISNAQKSGAMTAVSGRSRKALLFEKGSLVSAVSNSDEDSLGEILFRFGKVTRDQLHAAGGEVSGPRRLGKVLVERGIINSHELWTYIRRQVEEIFYSVLHLSEGVFYFSVPGKPESFPARVPMSSNALLMEGVRRMDELKHFRELIPTPEILIEGKWPPAQSVHLDPRDEALLKLTQKPITVAELARISRYGEFETTKAVFHLLKSGLVRRVEGTIETEPTAAGDGRVEALIDTFNQIFREIFACIERNGGSTELQSGIAAFLSSNAYAPLFAEVPFQSTGELSKRALLENLTKAGVENPADYLYAGLNELLFFEIFAAREILGHEEEQALMSRVNQLFQHL